MRILRGDGLAVLGIGIVSAAPAAVALGAPMTIKPPAISGKPVFGSLLTCNKGTWSPDAVSFDYSWLYAGGGPQIATGRTWRVDQTRLGYGVVCEVVAHDATGATATALSAQVVPTKATATVRITRISQAHGHITLQGVAGPAAATTPTRYAKPYVVLDRRLDRPDHLLQLGGLKVIPRSGKFTLTGSDSPGKHVYVVQFIAGPVELHDRLGHAQADGQALSPRSRAEPAVAR